MGQLNLHEGRALLADGSAITLENFPEICNSWSSMYRGDYNGRPVCVKIWRGEGLLLPSRKRTVFLRKLLQEVLAWQAMSHPNIGTVHGVLFTLYKLPSVVTPYYPNGDINAYVSNNSCTDLRALV
ncbi:hypothetical protein J3R30DRAFT_1326379 [Lentinula aciculospora]|uniref:Protein kinase domain-containing protein n=1 Tax=Lentinula aciculospora TaxID=153920 RepID=A0A9W9APF9_9AGAR|nr:hypothetical protein J3R30DRAFT_1326379 [Lentinula aciculospora]